MRALELRDAPAVVLNVGGMQPMAAVRLLKEVVADEESRKEWRKSARVAAIMGSCPKTRDSFVSGL